MPLAHSWANLLLRYLRADIAICYQIFTIITFSWPELAGDLKLLHHNCQNSFIFWKFCIAFAISNSKNSIHRRIGCWTLLGRNRNRNRIHICKSMQVYKTYIMIIWRATWLHCWLVSICSCVSCTANQVAIWWKTSRHRFLRDFHRFAKYFSNRSNFTTRNDSELPGTWRKVLHYLLRWLETHTASPTTTIRSFFFPHIFLIFVSMCCLIWLKDVMWFMWYRQNGVPFVSLLFLALVFPLNRPCSGVKAAAEHVKPCVWGPASCASIISGWWQLIFFQNFHPDFLGKWSQFDKYVEQHGWEKNQQLEI